MLVQPVPGLSDRNTIVSTYTSLQEIKRFLPYETQDVGLVTQHV